MKKIIGLVSLVLFAILLTGCGSSVSTKSGTITCVSDASGVDPSIVTYEKYVVKNNEIVEFSKHKTLKYSDSYLNKISIDSIFEVYEKDSNYKTEKVDDYTLKITYVEPENVYSDLETDDMIESIRASFEDNDFLLEKYTCEIE